MDNAKAREYLRQGANGCPECGGHESFEFDQGWDSGEVTTYVRCDICGARWSVKYTVKELGVGEITYPAPTAFDARSPMIHGSSSAWWFYGSKLQAFETTYYGMEQPKILLVTQGVLVGWFNTKGVTRNATLFRAIELTPTLNYKSENEVLYSMQINAYRLRHRIMVDTSPYYQIRGVMAVRSDYTDQFSAQTLAELGEYDHIDETLRDLEYRVVDTNNGFTPTLEYVKGSWL